MTPLFASPASIARLPVIDRVGVLVDCVKIASKAPLIVSVRTYVPLTIATPSTIAIAVSVGAQLAAEQSLERDPGHDER